MSRVQDLDTATINEFQFKWKIVNLSTYVANKDGSLDSHRFTVPALDDSEFYLRLEKRDENNSQFFLCRTDKGPESVKIHYSLTIEPFYFSDLQTFGKNSSCTKPGVFDLSEFIDNLDQGLVKDTLLIECCLWQSENYMCSNRNTPESPYPVFCSTSTVFPKEEKNFFVSLKDIVTTISPDSVSETSLKVAFSLKLLSYTTEGKTFNFTVHSPVTSPFFCRCKISLVDAVKERHILHDGRYHYSDGSVRPREAKFLIPRSMLDKKDLYIPNNELLLLCEFALSDGKPVSFVHSTRYNTSEVEDIKCSWSVYLNHFGNQHRFLFPLLAVLVLFLGVLPHLYMNNTL